MTVFFVMDETLSPQLKNRIIIRGTDLFYDYIKYTPSSYRVYSARLFGLNYADFLRMCRDKYNAVIVGKGVGYPYPLFDEWEDAGKLVKELNRRMTYVYNNRK